MMLRNVLWQSSRVLLPTAFMPALLWGQQRAIGPTLTRIISSGEGVERSCLQSGYSYGVGVRFVTPILTRLTTLQVTGRGYWLEQGSTCVDGFPPPDGIYIQDDRINLQSRSFVTTDVRMGVRLGETPVSLAVGGGNAWHEGYDLPYFVLAADVQILDRPGVRLGVGGEFQRLRVSADRFRRTYQDFQLIAEEPLGRVRTWSNAAIIGAYAAFPL